MRHTPGAFAAAGPPVAHASDGFQPSWAAGALQAQEKADFAKKELPLTHKLQLLSHVERLLVLDGGRVVADGPRQTVLQSLTEGRVRATQAGPS